LDNDLQVDSRFISRHHAQVVTTFEGSWIEDLNSTNGVYVRGKRIRRHRLAEGDVVQIGQHSLAYSRADLGGSTVAMEPDAEADPDADEAEVEGDESVATDHR
jgi:pSer/pThr/pTyr-binding forkhead associated (FHA) protein